MQIISRRNMFAGLTAGAGLAALTGSAKALSQCTPASYLPQIPGGFQPAPSICNAVADPKHIEMAAQQNSEWCWAASISMIFAYHGHQVDQQDIVNAGLGAVVNQPGNIQAIYNVLNRQWTDKAHNNFQSAAAILFSADVPGVPPPNNVQMINLLAQNKPMLICNMSHAMMLIQVNYIPPVNMPANVVAAVVVDPWPGVGIRALSPLEIRPYVPFNPMLGGQLRLHIAVDVM